MIQSNQKSIKLLNDIISFEGKRNCALTIFMSANSNYNKVISNLEKQIYTIKHENKKRQLISIIDKIKKFTKVNLSRLDYFKIKGIIICSGLSNIDSTVEYYEIEPNKIIKDNEYFYDYKFNLNKIYEKYFNKVEFIEIDRNELDKLRKNELILFKKEINIDTYDSISYIIHISNEFLDLNLCIDSIKYNFGIKIIKDTDKLWNLKSSYGDMIGILYYR